MVAAMAIFQYEQSLLIDRAIKLGKSCNGGWGEALNQCQKYRLIIEKMEDGK